MITSSVFLKTSWPIDLLDFFEAFRVKEILNNNQHYTIQKIHVMINLKSDYVSESAIINSVAVTALIRSNFLISDV